MNIGATRSLGFSLGCSDYVSFLDDDDEIVTEFGFFEKAINELDKDKSLSLVFGNELSNSSLELKSKYKKHKSFSDIHHPVVFRRSSLNKYLKEMSRWTLLPECTLYSSMFLHNEKMKHIDIVGYKWNIHEKNSKSLNIINSVASDMILSSARGR